MNTTATLPAAAAPAPMSVFERYLTVWVFLCIVAGVVLGQLLPGPIQAIGGMEVAKVNLPVGLLIWVMIIPMLLKVDFGALHQVRQHWRGIGVTLFVNWAVKPFSMALRGGSLSGTSSRPTCPPASRTATSPASSCWPPPPARPWCLYGVGSPVATPCSRSARWR